MVTLHDISPSSPLISPCPPEGKRNRKDEDNTRTKHMKERDNTKAREHTDWHAGQILTAVSG
jgi:hypothetical protein